MQSFYRQQVGCPNTVRKAEIDFSKWFKKGTGIQLTPSDDWYNPSTSTMYEIKDISYPSTRFPIGESIRLNLESIERHTLMGKTLLVLCFSDGIRMVANIRDVKDAAREDVKNTFGDRRTYFVPISIFKKISTGAEIA